MLHLYISLPYKVKCSGLLRTLFRQEMTQAAEKGQLQSPFSANLFQKQGMRHSLTTFRFLKGAIFSYMFLILGLIALYGWFLSTKNTCLFSLDIEMFLNTYAILLQKSLFARSVDFQKACFLLMFLAFFIKSYIITLRHQSLEIDQILKLGYCFLIMSRTEVFPDDGMVRGIKTITLLTAYSYLFYYLIAYSFSSASFSCCASSLLYGSSYSSSKYFSVFCTISINFSLLVFFCKSFRKSIKRLLTNLEIGLVWSSHKIKALFAVSMYQSRGLCKLNYLAIYPISFVNFLSRFSQFLLYFCKQIFSFSLNFLQMRYSMVLTLHIRQLCSPFSSTPLTQMTLPSPPSLIAISFIFTTISLSFSMACSNVFAYTISTLILGNPKVSKNLQVYDSGRHSSLLSFLSTKAQKYNCASCPQLTKCCILTILQYSPTKFLFESSNLIALTYSSVLFCSNLNQHLAIKEVCLYSCLFFSFQRSYSF